MLRCANDASVEMASASWRFTMFTTATTIAFAVRGTTMLGIHNNH
jgi:hypothetical protein